MLVLHKAHVTTCCRKLPMSKLRANVALSYSLTNCLVQWVVEPRLSTSTWRPTTLQASRSELQKSITSTFLPRVSRRSNNIERMTKSEVATCGKLSRKSFTSRPGVKSTPERPRVFFTCLVSSITESTTLTWKVRKTIVLPERVNSEHTIQGAVERC
jgi:hypothetical protein